MFDTTARTLSRERDAAREADGRTGRYWKIVNPGRRISVGAPTVDVKVYVDGQEIAARVVIDASQGLRQSRSGGGGVRP